MNRFTRKDIPLIEYNALEVKDPNTLYFITDNHWVVSERGCVITCSKCNERLELCYPDGTEVRWLPYCPWCGEKMKGGE